MEKRFFSVDEIIASSPTKATKFVIYENELTNAVVWYVPSGDEVPAHYHPHTDDVWVVLSGQGEYYLGNGETYHIKAGMVIPAEKGDIHGARAIGDEPLIFAAVLGPMPVKMILEGKQ